MNDATIKERANEFFKKHWRKIALVAGVGAVSFMLGRKAGAKKYLPEDGVVWTDRSSILKLANLVNKCYPEHEYVADKTVKQAALVFFKKQVY